MRMHRKAFTPILFPPQLLHPTNQCLAGAVANGCALCNACGLLSSPLQSRPAAQSRGSAQDPARQAAAYK